MKLFYFFLFCIRFFLLICFVLATVCLLPIIALVWGVYGQEMFDYLNEVCAQIGNIADKKIKEAKEKFYKPKLKKVSEL